MANKSEAIEKMLLAAKQLEEAFLDIKEINESAQFDYTTSSELSASVDRAVSLIEKIVKVVYQ